MADQFDKETRSWIMSRVKGKDTAPEIAVRSALWAKGYRYRVHYPRPWKPDIAFSGKKVAVFIDGCFWHGCPKHYTCPESHKKFWREKVRRNMERDKRYTREMRARGWKVIRLWEHDVNKDLRRCIRKIEKLVG
jgi:DNA mismatch endonuclease (patch repair protein)